MVGHVFYCNCYLIEGVTYIKACPLENHVLFENKRVCTFYMNDWIKCYWKTYFSGCHIL